MLSVVRHMRREVDRALEGRLLFGEEFRLGGEDGCRLWLHLSEEDGPRPAVLEIHGGGFVLGDARKGDALREWICRSFDVNVVGIDYRLAPEHPFPAALEDVVAVVRAMRAGELPGSWDGSRIYLTGYSAGANLALAASLALQGTGEEEGLRGLALHYPCMDAAGEPPVDPEAKRGLPVDLLAAFNEWYAGKALPRNPLVSPLYADSVALARLPFVSLYPVEGDPLLKQAKSFAARLAEAGHPVGWHVVANAYHGFVEDAADEATYRAVTMEKSVERRPEGAFALARETVRNGLEELLGPAKRNLPWTDFQGKAPVGNFGASRGGGCR